MTLKLPITLLQGIQLENKDLMQSAKRTTRMFIEVEHRHINEADRRALFIACQEKERTPEIKRLQRQLKSLLDIAKDPRGTKVQTLGAFKDALTALIQDLPNKRVYLRDKELRRAVPYFVERIQESGAARYGLPHVAMEMAATRLGQKAEKKGCFYNRDIRGKTLAQILEAEGIMLETPELNKEYQGHLELFQTFSKKIGEQFTAEAWVQLRETENRLAAKDLLCPDRPRATRAAGHGPGAGKKRGGKNPGRRLILGA